MTRYEAIKEALDNMNAADLVYIHNEYCDAVNACDDRIYSMEEFDEIMTGFTPWEIARAAYYSGKFCPAHEWFWFNGYGNLESDDFTPGNIYTSDIAEYIDRESDSLYNDEIQEILDEYEENEEED